MPIRICNILIAVALCLLSTRAHADVLLDWTELMVETIRLDNSGPPLSMRNLAILHTAIFDSVNSITESHQPYRFQTAAPQGTSVAGAAVAASYEVMLALYQPYRALADDLYQRHLSELAADPGLSAGLALGRQIAQWTVASRADDGANTDVPYIPSELPGQWRRTPPFFRPPLMPHWGAVDLFCLPELEAFLPPAPPALESPEYAAALNEVKVLGAKSSSVRTAEQELIARFWSDFNYTATPAGHWQLIVASIATNRGNSIEENARLFALLSLAQADAGIVCWAAKFRHNLWRPITAIQRADEDGNAATEGDPEWESLLPAPPFPAYMSGHSTFSKASGAVLTEFYGTDAISFTASSDSVPQTTRPFDSIAACVDEIGLSRIYGGIHFSFDNIEGKACGNHIGQFISRNFLLANDGLPMVRIESVSETKVRLLMHGKIAQRCVLEASTNLEVWQGFSTNLAQVGGVPVDHETPGPNRHRFYRVREERAE